MQSHLSTQQQDPGKVLELVNIEKSASGFAGSSLQVVQVRPDDNVILISGPVPGHKGSYVVVRPAVKKDAPAAKSE